MHEKYRWSWGFIGGNFGAVAWLLLSLSLPSGLIPWEGFWEENFYWIFFSEGHLGVYRVPCASWCLFGYCFLRNKYLMTCVLPLIIQRKETVWRFQVEAHVAYTCKQILGLCHSPRWMEYQVKVEKNLNRKKNSHESWQWRTKESVKSVCKV